MPILADSGMEYFFDFEQVIESLIDFYYSASYTKYLEDWKALLYKLNRTAQAEFALFESKCTPDGKSPEMYQFLHEYGDDANTYAYHFNIENILSNISENEPHKSLAPTKLIANIANYDSSIILDDRGVKPDPIVLCEFWLPNSKFLVIDGNTRLAYHLATHKWFVEYYTYEITHKEDFLFSVDWAMFNFVKEVNRILRNHRNKRKMEINIQNSKINNSSFIAEADRIYGGK